MRLVSFLGKSVWGRAGSATAVVFDMSTGLPWLSLPPMGLNDLLGTSARHVGKSTAVKMAGNSVEVFRRTKR